MQGACGKDGDGLQEQSPPCPLPPHTDNQPGAGDRSPTSKNWTNNLNQRGSRSVSGISRKDVALLPRWFWPCPIRGLSWATLHPDFWPTELWDPKSRSFQLPINVWWLVTTVMGWVLLKMFSSQHGQERMAYQLEWLQGPSTSLENWTWAVQVRNWPEEGKWFLALPAHRSLKGSPRQLPINLGSVYSMSLQVIKGIFLNSC